MTPLEPRRRARLLELAPWMLRDYLANQGLSTVIVVLLIGLVAVAPARALLTADAQADGLLRTLTEVLAFIGAFFATNGIVATDRRMGYYRFLFAKPVSPPVYYLLTFTVYGLGLLLVTLLLLGVWSFFVRPMFPLDLLAVVLFMYVVYGGIGLLVSAVFRFDWLSLVSVLLAANIAWSLWGASTSPAHVLLYVLPPVHRIGDVYAIIRGGAAIPWTSIAWLGAYGTICLAAGLVVIRRRPLGTG